MTGTLQPLPTLHCAFKPNRASESTGKNCKGPQFLVSPRVELIGLGYRLGMRILKISSNYFNVQPTLGMDTVAQITLGGEAEDPDKDSYMEDSALKACDLGVW